MEIVAAGGHHALLSGPPGSGKTLIARALPGILPKLTREEALEITRIYSVADKLPPGKTLAQRRPFRAPHHTISEAGLVGGGTIPRPGEITMSHRGVLYLNSLQNSYSLMTAPLRFLLPSPDAGNTQQRFHNVRFRESSAR